MKVFIAKAVIAASLILGTIAVASATNQALPPPLPPLPTLPPYKTAIYLATSYAKTATAYAPTASAIAKTVTASVPTSYAQTATAFAKTSTAIVATATADPSQPLPTLPPLP